MFYSEQILKLKAVNQKIKELQNERSLILKDLTPDVERAIKKMMDWESLSIKLDKDFFGDIKAEVTIPQDPNCRYVFTIEPKEEDTFKVSLDFREEFSCY